MSYWLFKSEPNCYAITDLKRDKKTWWDGVRNYQARTYMRDTMHVGERGLFYHSSAGTGTGVAGVLDIAQAARPDQTQFDPHSEYYDATSKENNPRWWCVQVVFVQMFPHVVTLADMRADLALADMKLLQHGNRLSIMPISHKHFAHIVRLGSGEQALK